MNVGYLEKVMGVVIDAVFPDGVLPGIHNALIIHPPESPALTFEVQEHINSKTVRAIALGLTTAIIGIVLYNYFTARVDNLGSTMEETSYEVLRTLQDGEGA